MDLQIGDPVRAPGIKHSGEVTELVPALGVVKFRSDQDGMVRSVDVSAVELAGAKARKQALNKMRGGIKDKG